MRISSTARSPSIPAGSPASPAAVPSKRPRYAANSSTTVTSKDSTNPDASEDVANDSNAVRTNNSSVGNDHEQSRVASGGAEPGNVVSRKQDTRRVIPAPPAEAVEAGGAIPSDRSIGGSGVQGRMPKAAVAAAAASDRGASWKEKQRLKQACCCGTADECCGRIPCCCWPTRLVWGSSKRLLYVARAQELGQLPFFNCFSLGSGLVHGDAVASVEHQRTSSLCVESYCFFHETDSSVGILRRSPHAG